MHWLLARSSVSRIGLIREITKNKRINVKVARIRHLLLEKWDIYWNKIIKEAEEIDKNIKHFT